MDAWLHDWPPSQCNWYSVYVAPVPSHPSIQRDFVHPLQNCTHALNVVPPSQEAILWKGILGELNVDTFSDIRLQYRLF